MLRVKWIRRAISHVIYDFARRQRAVLTKRSFFKKEKARQGRRAEISERVFPVSLSPVGRARYPRQSRPFIPRIPSDK